MPNEERVIYHGCYFWFGYDGKMVYPVYFGYGGALLESLRYLSLVGHYTVGTSSTLPVQARNLEYNHVSKLKGLFNKSEIYLTFLEVNVDEKTAQNAEAVCLNGCSSNLIDKSRINLEYYLNSQRETSHIDSLSSCSFNYYMNRTIDYINNRNYISFNLTEFLDLVEILKKNKQFKTNLENFNDPTKRINSVRLIYAPILQRAYFKQCKKHEEEHDEFTNSLNDIKTKKKLDLNIV